MTHFLTRLTIIPLILTIIIHWICESGSGQHKNFAYSSLKSAQIAYFIFILHFFATFIFSKNFYVMLQTQRQMAMNIILMILGDNLAPNFMLFVLSSIIISEIKQNGK